MIAHRFKPGMRAFLVQGYVTLSKGSSAQTWQQSFEMRFGQWRLVSEPRIATSLRGFRHSGNDRPRQSDQDGQSRNPARRW